LETIRKKRKTFRNKKKQIQRERKKEYFCHDTELIPIADKRNACIYEEGHRETGCHCHFLEVEESEIDYPLDNFAEEEEEMREVQKQKEEKLKSLYGEYVDTQPCFPPADDVSEVQLPSYLQVMDKIDIKGKMFKLQSSRERAKEIARHYRDLCGNLQIRIKDMEAKILSLQAKGLREKQRVRYFWRNEVLEEQSRSGKILRNAIKINATQHK